MTVRGYVHLSFGEVGHKKQRPYTDIAEVKGENIIRVRYLYLYQANIGLLSLRICLSHAEAAHFTI